ncbi:MAG: beta-glucoside-specific PTS transporter subunit IIABC [Lactobacillus mulieris]|uniref:beta-glucoside-specific PTS transporter subunit IIABC n=1 Tax=Lactobacillus mulieris TaxID=2508708 RepID=UPI0014333ABC|nr:beta-glucoside-specific PTS transporter subunit IIABC [Lactobacillus mulieris]MCF1783993.1 beta-glucoside-specific PTS transporter subunit IIABC [Lactobacillus mulieris]MCT7674288.1 beta-glucoside-specific PTS transporter subunit IIABC [Lactobacillus mulieris]MCT7772546.1 beta-glucoside-specific PTS transporter subunit IIABC [Lactobacillus mulieris]MCW8104785.1 beta-glucoside-specific PTS transporter subunit IIABC [Lactobacillus mulieris]MCZ9649991.1 beta-glucoside-specific PTS transporter 
MDANKVAKEIIPLVGGKDNINDVFHCVTRLRMHVKDTNKVNLKKISQISGVIGAQYRSGQLQIIIGSEVEDIYSSVTKQLGDLNDSSKTNQKEKFRFSNLFEIIASIFLPVVPALAGAGMIKGLVTILTTYMHADPKSDLIVVLSIVGDCVFYFLPFFVAWSAAKKFETDIPCSLALAGCLLYPVMTDGFLKGTSPMHFLSMPIPFFKYAGSSIPIILTVLVLKYIFKWINKLIPKALRMIFTPMMVLLVIAPLTLAFIAPLASYIAQGLVAIVKFFYGLSPLVAGAVVGGTRLFVVMTGMHLALGAVCIENINQLGYDFLLPMNTMGTMALFGACLAVAIRAKSEKNKAIGGSTALSAFLGITEPGIYGVFVKFKTAMLATVIGGALGGSIVGAFGGRATAYVNSCILSLPVFMTKNFWAVCVGMAVSTVTSFLVVMILGVKDSEKKVPVQKKDKFSDENIIINSPIEGQLKSLNDIDDEIFASGAMGKGVAITPTNNLIVSPFSGVIKTIFPTKHAIGLISDTGIQVVIHVGIDTANLKGKYFETLVKENDHIEAGQPILKADLAKIIESGYSVISPIIVVNSKDYLDVLPTKTTGEIKKGEKLLTVLK